MSETSTKVAKGIYRIREGRYYSVRWPNEFGKTVSKVVLVADYPGATGLKQLKEWRTKQKANARGNRRTADGEKGALARRALAWLKDRKKLKLPSYFSEQSHLRAWMQEFPGKGMDCLTPKTIQDVVTRWRTETSDITGKPLSVKTVQDRVNTLGRFCFAEDPAHVPPTKMVKFWKDSHPAEKSDAPVEMIRQVALNLRQKELNGYITTGKTRARYLVFATTGIRPTQIRATKPHMVNLTDALPYWQVPPGKGDNGTMIPLQGESLRAWQLFAHVNAWGHFDPETLTITVQNNGWRKTANKLDGPYSLRRSLFNAMKRAGRSTEQIGEYSGHKKSDTLSKFYLDATLHVGVHATVATVAHRLGLEGTAAFDTTPIVRKTRRGRAAQRRRDLRESDLKKAS